MHRLTTALGILLLLTATSALADTTVVKVGHNRLDPAQCTVDAGSAVTFHNEDEMPGGHTIVADDGSFESPPLAKDQEWSHTFEKAGTYTYSIKQHPSAKGTITVK
jgi:plastocyanin